jgi:hypothetical protein
MDKYTRDSLARLAEMFREEMNGAEIMHYGGTMIFYFPREDARPHASESAVEPEDAGLPSLLV